ncbi:MAG TPA: NAD-dependent epimerase/dehydratase family protein [Longimicrobiales bacterium]|nr:NAD-dependent epimerase/dehydratase family protein [Longimicrobiales bacterium]
MKILITGGTGLIGQSTAAALRERGHTLRILSRHADRNEAEAGVEYWPASVTDVTALAGAAQICDVVLHIAGIVEESPPDLTFTSVNVEGTRNIVREATASGVRRLVYISSFGADTGKSDYHGSKREAEAIARNFAREVIIVRPGNVYGPGDGVISSVVKLVRALPAIPVIDEGDQPFQPVWHEDIAQALARIIETSDVPGEPLNLVGPDVVTPNRLLDIVGEITGQQPKRIPLPSGLAGIAARLAATVGVDIPLKPDVLQMLLDGNALAPGQQNHLTQYVERPTPVTSGMRQLLECMPTQELEDGYGRPQHRRFVVDIRQPVYGADELFRMFCADYDRFLPVQRAEQQGNPHQAVEGETLTLALPLRGDIPVRVEEASDNAVTLVTVEGHPLAGFVRLTWTALPDGVRYEINAYDRPATLIDTIGMALGGSFAQRRTWINACETMVQEARGEAPAGVQHETRPITEEQAAKVQEWLDNRRSRSGARD